MPDTILEADAADKPLIILVPVFNDWAALGQLLLLLDEVLAKHSRLANVLIVDDGSTVPAGADDFPKRTFQALDRVDVLQLRRNLGHQRAIAVGLAYIADKVPCRAVIVMDSDGEDDPRDVPRLIQKYYQEGERKIIFAERTQRSETRFFRMFYSLYRAFHYLLTSQKVRVGNFSIIPAGRLASLVVVSEIWNHYASAVYKSRQPLDSIPTKRACRLVGESKMNFAGLVIHGLSAISVYSDVVGVRLMVMTFLLIVLAVTGLCVVVGVRLLTNLAVPGWATYCTGLLVIVLLQAVMFSLAFSFLILGTRQGSTFLPLRDYSYFVGPTTTLYLTGAHDNAVQLCRVGT